MIPFAIGAVLRLASKVPRRFTKVPRTLLKAPKSKIPKTYKFKEDMDALGAQIAEEFKETVKRNIETNKFKYTLAESTRKKKHGGVPLINSGVMLDAIYREGTFVSVEDTPRTDSPLTNLQLAKVHEYGTKDKHIPARPVWRDSFAAFKPVARKRIEQFFKKHGSKR